MLTAIWGANITWDLISTIANVYGRCLSISVAHDLQPERHGTSDACKLSSFPPIIALITFNKLDLEMVLVLQISWVFDQRQTCSSSSEGARMEDLAAPQKP